MFWRRRPSISALWNKGTTVFEHLNLILNQLDDGSSLLFVALIEEFPSLFPVYIGVKLAHEAGSIFDGAVVVQYCSGGLKPSLPNRQCVAQW